MDATPHDGGPLKLTARVKDVNSHPSTRPQVVDSQRCRKSVSFLIQSTMLGKLVHLSVDALLISAFLAGIKRSTGLSPALSKVGNKDLRQLAITYLEFGEWVMDLAIVVMGRSTAFERKR